MDDALWHVVAGDDDAALKCLEELSGPQLREMAQALDTLAGLIAEEQRRRGGRGFVAPYLSMPPLLEGGG